MINKMMRFDRGGYMEIFECYVESDGGIYSLLDIENHRAPPVDTSTAETMYIAVLHRNKRQRTLSLIIPDWLDEYRDKFPRSSRITAVEICATENDFTSLEYLYIPESVRHLKISAQYLVKPDAPLSRCKVEISPDNPCFCVYKNGIYSRDMKTLHYIFSPHELPGGCYEVPDGVEYIGKYAARFLKGLIKLVIPESVKAVGNHAFWGCPDLEEADVRAEVLENGAFNECKKLRSVRLPNCKKIGDYAFSGCSGLTSAELGCAEEIGSRAFEFSGIETLTLPPSVREIGDYFIRSNRPDNQIKVELYFKEGEPLFKWVIQPIADEGTRFVVRSAETGEFLFRFVMQENIDLDMTGIRTLKGYKAYISQKNEERLMKTISLRCIPGEIAEDSDIDMIEDEGLLRLIDKSAELGKTELTAALMQKLHERKGHEQTL